MRTDNFVDASFDGVAHPPAKRWPRNERRLLVEIEALGSGTSVGGQLLSFGKNRILIYASELAEAQAKVRKPETQARLDVALAQWGRLLADHQKHGGTEFNMVSAGLPGSPYEILAADPLFHGGLGPLKSVKVISDDVPPPPTTETLQQNQFDRLGAVFERALAGAGGGMSAAEIQRAIDEGIERGVAKALAERKQKNG